MELNVLWAFPQHTSIFSNICNCVLGCFVLSIIYPLFYSLVFSPAIIILCLLFKKVKKPLFRMFLISFMIPFNNLIYLLIEHYCFFDKTQDIIAMCIGGTALIFVLPIIFVATFFIPNSMLSIENKKRVLLTNILMGICGWLFIILAACAIRYIDNQIDKSILKKYDVMINEIEEYKIKNGTYPQDLVVIYNPNKSQRINYEVYNERKDYKLIVERHNVYYNYCSNTNIDGCKVNADNAHYCSKFGKWIKIVDDD